VAGLLLAKAWYTDKQGKRTRLVTINLAQLTSILDGEGEVSLNFADGVTARLSTSDWERVKKRLSEQGAIIAIDDEPAALPAPTEPEV
jgi:hypothetical protein